MRTLLELAPSHEGASLAVEMFVYNLSKAIAGLMVPLGRGGRRALVFTGGIGENSPVIRSRVMKLLEFLGLEEDAVLNHSPGVEGRITRYGSKVMGLVIPTNEELLVARETDKVLLG